MISGGVLGIRPITSALSERHDTRSGQKLRGISSGDQGKILFFRSPGCVCKSLQDIFPFDVGIGCQDFVNRLSRCHQAHYCPNGHAHTPDTGFPSHDSRVHGDAIQLFHGFLHAIRRLAPCPSTLVIQCEQCCSDPCLAGSLFGLCSASSLWTLSILTVLSHPYSIGKPLAKARLSSRCGWGGQRQGNEC